MVEIREAPERSLEEAVSRALRDNLAPLQRTANEFEQALADFVAACSSAKPSNALPPMLRAQAFAASLSASLSALSNFAAIALNVPGRVRAPAAEDTAHEPAVASASTVAEQPRELPLDPQREAYAADAERVTSRGSHAEELELEPEPTPAAAETHFEEAAFAPSAAETGAGQPVFDLSSFPAEIQDLHRRANRVAKVAMQDIKLLRPQDVQLGREHKDICERLRSDLDKARKEYDRRFRAIQEHPVDYFHRWMVEILAQGNEAALGEYPYPSPVLRQ